MDGGVSSLCLYGGGGGDPSLPLGSAVTPPFLQSIALCTVGLLLRRTGGNTWEGALPPPFTQRSLFFRHPSAIVLTLNIGGIDLGCGGDIIVYIFTPVYTTAET